MDEKPDGSGEELDDSKMSWPHGFFDLQYSKSNLFVFFWCTLRCLQ